MAEDEDPTGVAELATEAVAPIEGELRERLLVDVGEQDSVAIEAALLKAFINGMQTGASRAAASVIEQSSAVATLGGTQVQAAELDPPLPRLDPWAERYGGGEG